MKFADARDAKVEIMILVAIILAHFQHIALI